MYQIMWKMFHIIWYNPTHPPLKPTVRVYHTQTEYSMPPRKEPTMQAALSGIIQILQSTFQRPTKATHVVTMLAGIVHILQSTLPSTNESNAKWDVVGRSHSHGDNVGWYHSYSAINLSTTNKKGVPNNVENVPHYLVQPNPPTP